MSNSALTLFNSTCRKHCRVSFIHNACCLLGFPSYCNRFMSMEALPFTESHESNELLNALTTQEHSMNMTLCDTKPMKPCISNMIKRFCQSGQLEELNEYLSSIASSHTTKSKTNILENIKLLESLLSIEDDACIIELYLSLGRVKTAFNIVQILEESHPLIIEGSSFHSVPVHYLNSAMPKQLLLLRKMKENLPPPNEKVYNALLRWATSNADRELSSKILKVMKLRKIKPTLDTFSIFLKYKLPNSSNNMINDSIKTNVPSSIEYNNDDNDMENRVFNEKEIVTGFHLIDSQLHELGIISKNRDDVQNKNFLYLMYYEYTKAFLHSLIPLTRFKDTLKMRSKLKLQLMNVVHELKDLDCVSISTKVKFLELFAWANYAIFSSEENQIIDLLPKVDKSLMRSAWFELLNMTKEIKTGEVPITKAIEKINSMALILDGQCVIWLLQGCINLKRQDQVQVLVNEILNSNNASYFMLYEEYSKIITILISNHFYELANKVLLYLKDHKIEMTLEGYNAMLKYYQNHNMKKEMQALLLEMEAKNIQFNHETYHYLFILFENNKHILKKILQKFIKEEKCLNGTDYNLLGRCYYEKHEKPFMLYSIPYYEKGKIAAEVQKPLHMVEYYWTKKESCNTEQGCSIDQRFQEDFGIEYKPSIHAYNAQLFSLLCEHHIGSSEKGLELKNLLLIMQQNKVIINEETLNLLLKILVDMNEFNIAKKGLFLLFDWYIKPSDHFVVQFIRYQKSLFKNYAYVTSLPVTALHWTILIQGLLKQRDFESVEGILQAFVKYHPKAYDPFITDFSSYKYVEPFIENSLLYDMFIRTSLTQERNIIKIYPWVQMMFETGLNVEIYTLNLVLKHLLEVQEWNACLDLLQTKAGLNGSLPDQSTMELCMDRMLNYDKCHMINEMENDQLDFRKGMIDGNKWPSIYERLILSQLRSIISRIYDLWEAQRSEINLSSTAIDSLLMFSTDKYTLVKNDSKIYSPHFSSSLLEYLFHENIYWSVLQLLRINVFISKEGLLVYFPKLFKILISRRQWKLLSQFLMKLLLDSTALFEKDKIFLLYYSQIWHKIMTFLTKHSQSKMEDRAKDDISRLFISPSAPSIINNHLIDELQLASDDDPYPSDNESKKAATISLNKLNSFIKVFNIEVENRKRIYDFIMLDEWSQQ